MTLSQGIFCFTSTPAASGLEESTRRWEGTQPGHLIPTDQSDIPYPWCCAPQEELQEGICLLAVLDGALLSWRWPNTPCPSEEWANSLLCFHIQLLPKLSNCLYLSPRDFSLSASVFSPSHLGGSKQGSSCVGLASNRTPRNRQTGSKYLLVKPFLGTDKEREKENKKTI